MDPARWRQICDVFQDAIERAPDARHSFLADACGGDAILRERVERLVRAHDRAAGFLARPALETVAHLRSPDDPTAAVVPPRETSHVDLEFPGTDRYTVLHRLGAGGMGVVYAVHDGLRNEAIALKTLRRADPAEIYRLKREFRSLADLAHPNVVCLHELVVEPEHCFFTMELVDGVHLQQYVRTPVVDARTASVPGSGADAGLVRSVLRQIVAGLSELHGKGKLHRDIKPSNVMVRPDGRVVILDFGLMSDARPGDAKADDRMAGTPAYLAPELHAGADPSEASDWYALGVTLYEALTGRVPFDGSWQELSWRKSHSDPLPPSSLQPDIPDDLSEICMGLLCRDPQRRLSGRDAVGKLADGAPRQETGRSEPQRLTPFFVGRARQLGILAGSFATVKEGRAAAVCVHGPPGIGKTALVQRFLDQVPGDDAVVLRGRCHQHETVPYEALDATIDSLTTYLRGLPPAHAAALVPPDAAALARAFPVMLQVEAVAHAPRARSENPEPFAQRHLAFSALRELLTRIAQRQPLVLHIDDLHWADADSLRLLEALLRPPNPPPLLMLACLRTEEIASKPFLQALLHGRASPFDTTVSLEPMTEDEALEVVASLMPAGTRITEAERRELAREAGGNPFLLEQLAHYSVMHDARGNREATLADMLQHRLQDSADGARRFLEVLAVCGRPMPPQVVYEAAGLAGDERPLVAILHSDHLLRHSGSATHIETYHDRIRETLAAQLSPDETRGIHGILVRTLMARGADDPEALFEHCKGAGDGAGASRHAALAAAEAREVLAFDRAAFFYRNALELTPDAPAADGWKQGLAESLTNAGRPAEAAGVYLEASAGADGWRRVDLQRRAAEQFLIGGHIDSGIDVIGTVLRALHMQLPRSPLGALASLLWRRARIRRRGLAFVERDSDSIPAATLLRVDTCWSVTTGLLMVDSIRAADFNTRHLLLALDAGEPYRIGRALALEGAFVTSGGTNLQYAARCTERAASLARQSGRPHAEALSTLAAGMSALLTGQWRTAAQLCERTLVVLRDQCTGVTWEMNCGESFLLYALLFLGEIGEVSRRLPALLTAARERGNRYFETELRTRLNVVWLAADQPDEGERQANEAMEGWSHQGFHRQHYSHVLARVQTELYRGDAEAAWRLITSNWTAFERTLLLRVRFLRVETSYLRARAALLQAARGGDVRRFLSVARADAQRIERFGMGWSDGVALLIGATVTHLEGRSGNARDALHAAVEAFERADMRFHAAVARRRLGALHDGERGRALVDAADTWMAAQGIRNPARIARLIAPGFPDPEGT